MRNALEEKDKSIRELSQKQDELQCAFDEATIQLEKERENREMRLAGGKEVEIEPHQEDKNKEEVIERSKIAEAMYFQEENETEEEDKEDIHRKEKKERETEEKKREEKRRDAKLEELLKKEEEWRIKEDLVMSQVQEKVKKLQDLEMEMACVRQQCATMKELLVNIFFSEYNFSSRRVSVMYAFIFFYLLPSSASFICFLHLLPLNTF